MAFDIFISYSQSDKSVADSACATLEQAGIRCWIAPRDIRPGDEYGTAIVNAIDCCRAMVLIFSSRANSSQQIRREVERAVSHGVPILPVRIEDVLPTDSLAYFVESVHWLDAITPPLEGHLKRLTESVTSLLQTRSTPSALARTRFGVTTSPLKSTSPGPSISTKVAALVLAMSVGAVGATYLLRMLPPAVTNDKASSSANEPSNAGSDQIRNATVTPQRPTKDLAKTDIAHQSVTQATQSDPVIRGVAGKELPDTKALGDKGALSQSPQRQPEDQGPPARSPAPADPADVSRDAPSAPGGAASGGSYFTADDVARVETIAAQKKMRLPSYKIEAIDPTVPANLRRYIGIWVSQIGYNGGLGPEAMLIISNVDSEGRINGWYISGPPTPKSYDQRPAFSILVSGTIKKDVLSIETSAATAAISFRASNALGIKWARKDGRSATNILNPVWTLFERESASLQPTKN